MLGLSTVLGIIFHIFFCCRTLVPRALDSVRLMLCVFDGPMALSYVSITVYGVHLRHLQHVYRIESVQFKVTVSTDAYAFR